MAKSKKAAAQYESGTLAAFAVVGILLIALGVVSLLAVVGGLKGALFTMVKRVMQGLGGGRAGGFFLRPKHAQARFFALYTAVFGCAGHH